MAFSLFTKSSPRISRRLRWLGRGFQLWAALVASLAVASFIFVLSNPTVLARLPAASRQIFALRVLSFAVVGTASLFLTGRALLRRQRSGLYASAVILIAPVLYRSTIAARLGLTRSDAVVGIGAALLLASVWKEVHDDVVELDDADDPDDENIPLTPRNRGYGEPRRVTTSFALAPQELLNLAAAPTVPAAAPTPAQPAKIVAGEML